MGCILVVEDEAAIRELLAEFISDAGFEIVEAGTAEAAVPLLELEKLSVIVTDINLPGQLNGIDLALTAGKTRPNVPVVFISGRPAMLEEARAVCNAALFLQKPFSLKVLVGDLHRLTGII